ncbi:MAG: hypothetical protein SFY80_09400 [Verrucomicrobiota bacterium]|nr:hypothetical protein [Verrucomicrobiota bacterium]
MDGLGHRLKGQVYGIKVATAWETIVLPPDLQSEGIEPDFGEPGNGRNEPNDHTLFRDRAGMWRLWACVRLTSVGRVLCQWQSPSLASREWTRCPGIIRCDRKAGESNVEWKGQEFIQSPYVVQANDQYYMYYGGYDTGYDRNGIPTDNYDQQEKQLCLMTSKDGVTWHRHQNGDGSSRVFWGPGAVRDPVIVKLGSRWYAYYSGHHDQNRNRAGIYVRYSDDLMQWSEWHLAHYDPQLLANGRPCIHESPFVVEKSGLYYLLRNPGIHGGTHVFVSDDPLDFGIGTEACNSRFVAHLPDVIAPELIQDSDGTTYITRINSPDGYRIQIARLQWNEL